jgi:hypothetical protein
VRRGYSSEVYGGVGGWYLLCQSCRAGYATMSCAKRGTALPSPVPQSVGTEAHRTMMRNAVFLLRLHSTAEDGSTVRRVRVAKTPDQSQGPVFPVATGFNTALVFGDDVEPETAQEW